MHPECGAATGYRLSDRAKPEDADALIRERGGERKSTLFGPGTGTDPDIRLDQSSLRRHNQSKSQIGDIIG